MRAPAPYRAQDSYLDQEESKDQTLEPDRAVANDNGSSTPPAPKEPAPYQPAQESVSAARPVAQQPTFSQMQAAGEARPPMPAPEAAQPASAAPIQTMTGEWTPPTASAQSAPLIATTAGGTMTPQGDVSNAFRGYESADGGTFGGAYSDKADPNLWSAVANGDPASWMTAINGSDPALQQAALTEIAKKMDSGTGGPGAGVQMWNKLTPEQQAEVRRIATTGTGGFAADQMSAREAAALQAMSPEARGQAFDRLIAGAAPASAALPQGRLAGNTTAADPAEQARLLEQMQRGEIPSGPQGTPPSGQPTPFPGSGQPEQALPTPGKVASVPAQTGGAGPVSPSPSAPVNGAGVPGGSNPSSLDILGQLMGGATAPGKYGTQQVKDAYDWMGGQIDDQYKLAEKDLQEEMARRGLSTSTIGAGRLSDLNVGRRSAKEALAYDLGDKIASTGAADQSSRLDWLRNLIGYGQQGFENDLATANFNANQNNNWQDFLLKMLGAGYGTAGA